MKDRCDRLVPPKETYRFRVCSRCRAQARDAHLRKRLDKLREAGCTIPDALKEVGEGLESEAAERSLVDMAVLREVLVDEVRGQGKSRPVDGQEGAALEATPSVVEASGGKAMEETGFSVVS